MASPFPRRRDLGVFLLADQPFRLLEPTAALWFNDSRRLELHGWLPRNATPWLEALEDATHRMDGFESPFGIELLASVDWLLQQVDVAPTVTAVSDAFRSNHARQFKVFDQRAIGVALDRLEPHRAH